jgi:hypothetical protein
MKQITVVIEYENAEDIPVFRPNMTALGGKIMVVAFEDALGGQEEKDK